MEKQRSRVQWLHEGDWNTNFFQAKVKQCSRTNKIRALRRADGSLCEPQEELEGLAAGFYGDQRRARRSESWRLLRFLKNQASFPWLVHIARSGSLQGGRRGKLFRYENMWQRHHLYNDTVTGGWNGGCMNLEDVECKSGAPTIHPNPVGSRGIWLGERRTQTTEEAA